MYEAEIEEIDRENGTAAVTFIEYGNAEVIPLQNLRAAEEGKSSEDGKPKSKYVLKPLTLSQFLYFTHPTAVNSHYLYTPKI